MFPLVNQRKAASSSSLDDDSAATLSTHAPLLKDAAERVTGSIVKNLQKMATITGAIEGRVREVAWRDMMDIVGTVALSGVSSLLDCADIPCVMLVTLDEMLIYGLVDLLCGGTGSEAPSANSRNATPIDQQFAQIAFTFLASAIETEWSAVGFTSATVAKVESLTPDLLGSHIASVGCLDLSISIYGLAGTIRLVMPPNAIERFVASEVVADISADADDDWGLRLNQEIGQTTVKLDAYLDGNEIDLASLAALRIGQIISLPPETRARVSLITQGQVLFRGEIGQADDRYSLRIEDVVSGTRMTAPIVAPRARSQTPELSRA